MAENPLPGDDAAVVRLPGASMFHSGPGSVTLTLFGEVDTSGTPMLEAALGVMWAENPRQVVVDLSEVGFLSPAALHALLRTRRTAQQQGAQLTVTTGSAFMTGLLGMAGAGDVTRRKAGGGARRPAASGTREVSDEAPFRGGRLTLLPESVAAPPAPAGQARRPPLRTTSC